MTFALAYFALIWFCAFLLGYGITHPERPAPSPAQRPLPSEVLPALP